MLEQLTVKNYALIDNLSVQFEPGFNALTGETGTGKSILIDALSLALGGRGSAESVREGEDEAEVTARFQAVDSPELRDWIEKYNIEPEDGVFIIRRTLKSNGRGSAGIQTIPVTRGALAELANVLVDIYGQHEHQSLFRVATHRKFLDRYAGIEERVRQFTSRVQELSELGKQIEELKQEEQHRMREAEFLRYAVDEITEASLVDGEEEELEERQQRLSRHEELAGYLEGVVEGSSESRNGALTQLRIAMDSLTKATAIDPSLDGTLKRFNSMFYEFEDIVEDIRKQWNETEFNPSELEGIDNRLARIGTLQKKYGVASVAALIAFAQDASESLEGYKDRDEELRRLTARKDEMQSVIIQEAGAISIIRKSASQALQEKVEKHLKSLGMGDARFAVELEGKRNDSGRPIIGPYGSDVVEFLFSANLGESPKPLKAVASGGELSRVMLAIKTVLSESDTVQTMVFDEVDTGIGGEVARSVGEHLHGLSSRKQVFCITHLASIAVFADNHLQVDKDTENGRTVTRIQKVDGESRIREVARMLAGDREGAASLDHATLLLEEHSQRNGRTDCGLN